MVKAVDNICHVMEKIIKQISPAELEQIGSRISEGVGHIIEQSKHTIAVYLNSEVSMTYWRIGKYIAGELDAIGEEKYGSKIVATVSRQLTAQFGKGYTRDAIFRMVKVARAYPNEEIVGTLSRQLTWSHFIELSEIHESSKRLFYQQMSILNHWSVRQLRDQEDAMAYERSLIAAKPDDEQVKVLTTVTQGDIAPDIILKSSYVVDFLGLKKGFSENELEDAVVEQLEKFILRKLNKKNLPPSFPTESEDGSSIIRAPSALDVQVWMRCPVKPGMTGYTLPG